MKNTELAKLVQRQLVHKGFYVSYVDILNDIDKSFNDDGGYKNACQITYGWIEKIEMENTK